MFNPFENLTVEIFGQSHGEEIGVSVRGLPAGRKIDESELQRFVDRRKSSGKPWSTPRKEEDKIIIDSGIDKGITTGGEFRAHITNTQARPEDYEKTKNIPRPSHADYVSYIKYGEIPSGGGRFSGRMTAPMCVAGAAAKQILEQKGIKIGAYISSIGRVRAKGYDDGAVTYAEIAAAQKRALPVLDSNKTDEMTAAIEEARKNGDSLGGTVECVVFNMPIGAGDALYDGLEGRIAASVFAVPAVKGIEFGLGFGLAAINGSEANDAFYYESGEVRYGSNNSGGINGGMSNGENITLRVAFRPTPSIAKPQKSINLDTKENVVLQIAGRHDACIVPRAAAAVEAAVALTILDSIIK